MIGNMRERLAREDVYLMRAIALILLIALAAPHTLLAASSKVSLSEEFLVSGWIPYWSDTPGTKDAKRHINDIDVINPFAYVVRSDGTIRDLAGLDEKNWRDLFKVARRKDVAIIPTVMWSDGAQIHGILSGTTTRAAHIAAIVAMVKTGKYDGVDIDYESKLAETKNHFSQFLKELKKSLGKKLLTCAIEARTPPESLYHTVPTNLEYANDYTEIAKHCDRIALMTYDQQRADLILDRAKNGAPYMPLADVDWVRKVVELALKDIPKEKLVLGIPTYGHHYEVTVAPEWYKDYRRIGALNPPDALDIAKKYRATPTRNKAGELSFTYLPEHTVYTLRPGLTIPKNTPKGDTIAARALAHANATGEEVMFNLVWWSDAEAVGDKLDLAKEYGLLGVALFKIDGEEDQNIWKKI
jgi:spore germination protein YaaH